MNAWTRREVGDRIINQHDELEREPGHLRAERLEHDANEELYLVHRGHARFDLDGEQVDAPAGTFVFVAPGVMRTAFAEEPETTIVALGGVPGKAYEPVGWEIWRPLHHLYESGEYTKVADRERELIETTGTPSRSITSLAAKASRGGHPTRSSTSGSRSPGRSSTASGSARLLSSTPTSIRSATSRPSRN